MKLLVIAATGNLGKAIVNAALRDGHDVSVLVRDGTKVPWNGEQLTKVYVSASGSLGDQVAIALAGDTFDAVALAVGAQAADSAEINQCVRPAWRYYLLILPPRRSVRVLGVLARGALGLLTRTFDFRTGGGCGTHDDQRRRRGQARARVVNDGRRPSAHITTG